MLPRYLVKRTSHLIRRCILLHGRGHFCKKSGGSPPKKTCPNEPPNCPPPTPAYPPPCPQPTRPPECPPGFYPQPFPLKGEASTPPKKAVTSIHLVSAPRPCCNPIPITASTSSPCPPPPTPPPCCPPPPIPPPCCPPPPCSPPHPPPPCPPASCSGRKKICPPPCSYPGPIPPNPCCPQYHTGKDSFKKYKLLFAAMLPVIVILTLYNLGSEPPHKKECREFEYMRRRTKRFPWGEGNKTFFHNDHVNHLPEECQPPPMACKRKPPEGKSCD